MNKLIASTALFILSAIVFPTLGLANIKATKVSGPVNVVSASGARAALSSGAILSAGDTVETGAGGSAILTFSNNATINISPNSSLNLETYNHTNPSVATSTSTTRLKLNSGDVIGQVKGLRGASKFEVATQVGVAGIRGTIFRVSLQVVAGQTIMRITNADGSVVISSANVSSIISPTSLNVGQEAVITVDTASGTVTYTNLTPSQVAQIVQVINPDAGGDDTGGTSLPNFFQNQYSVDPSINNPSPSSTQQQTPQD